MKQYVFNIFFFSIFLLPFSSVVAGDGSGENSDTAKSELSFNEDFLFRSGRSLSHQRLLELEDSLMGLDPTPHHLVKRVGLYRDLESRKKEEVVMMIDSMFTLDSIPVSLINMVRLYIARHKHGGNRKGFLQIPGNHSLFPAHPYYGEWTTDKVNPYGKELSESDTTLELCLRNNSQNCGFHPPIEGKITSRFGLRDGRNHNGIDIDLQVWDPVKSAFAGRVRFAGRYGGYGRVVVVRHYNGLETVYAHLHRFKVKTGEIVEAGDVIGLGGSSGHSTGSHLHFEARFKGIPLNPQFIFSFSENELLGDTLVLKKNRWDYAAYPKGTKFHKVERGDFLYKISKQYGVPMDKICEWNGIRRNTILQVGDKLRIGS